MRLWRLAILLVSVSLWTGCSKEVKTVLPDSRELRPVVVCPQGVTCATDPVRYTIDAGYLRDILQELERCGRKDTR